MGAIKDNFYTTDEWDSSLIARGISHPARVYMRVYILKKLRRGARRNLDFCQDLRMTQSTVKDHLDKLLDAELITADYYPHFYLLMLNERRVRLIEQLIRFED